MAYKSNIVTNPDAATGDTTGWDEDTNVTVEGGVTDAVDIHVRMGDSITQLWGTWLDNYKVFLAMEGDDDTNYFLLDPSARLSQGILTGFSVDFKDGKLTCVFKFLVEQDTWDSKVIGRACAKVEYSDGSFSTFIIPCVKGLTYEGRTLLNDWIKEEAICLQ